MKQKETIFNRKSLRCAEEFNFIIDLLDTREVVIAEIERLRDSDEADFSVSEDGFGVGHNQGFTKACRMILDFIRNPKEA